VPSRSLRDRSSAKTPSIAILRRRWFPTARRAEQPELQCLHENPEVKETTMTQAVIRNPGEGRTIAVVGDVYRFLATGEDTSGNYALWEAIVPSGGGPPPHVHSREEEGFYVLEGEISFTVGDQRLIARAGTFANMPVGTLHSFKNESKKPARMLISVAPAGLEQMFFEVGVPLPPGATTAAPPTKEEIEKLLAVAPKYGIEIRLLGR
jgi:quercetin dioxygenase-like cupin family protein